MKKFLLSLVALTLFGSMMVAQDNYWYVRGNFNNYNPAGNEEWALYDDDEQSANIYSNLFTLAAGSVSFNVMDNQGNIYIPATAANGQAIKTQNLDFSTDHTFKGYFIKASQKQNNNYWTVSSWVGGQIQIYINADTSEIEVYAFPQSSDYNNDYTITPLNDNQEITIYWKGAIDDVWYESGNAYISDAAGNQTTLLKNISGQPGQVTLEDADPYGLSIDLSSLNLEAGDYTLTIPAKYIQIVSNDWEDWLYNPEISYKFTITGTSGVNSILNVDEKAVIYNLQGVKMPNDLNKLNRGVYIINGKKAFISK